MNNCNSFKNIILLKIIIIVAVKLKITIVAVSTPSYYTSAS